MDTKSDDQFIAIEATIEANKQDADKKHQEFKSSINKLTTLIMDQINISKSSPAQKDSKYKTPLEYLCDMAPDLDENSKYKTPLECLCDMAPDLDPIFVSSNMPPDPSADLA